MLATTASVFLCAFKISNRLVNRLARTTSIISLKEIPAIKARPPAVPLFRLCLITVKTMGPTDMASSRPSVIPFNSASVIAKRNEVTGLEADKKVWRDCFCL